MTQITDDTARQMADAIYKSVAKTGADVLVLICADGGREEVCPTHGRINTYGIGVPMAGLQITADALRSKTTAEDALGYLDLIDEGLRGLRKLTSAREKDYPPEDN